MDRVVPGTPYSGAAGNKSGSGDFQTPSSLKSILTTNDRKYETPSVVCPESHDTPMHTGWMDSSLLRYLDPGKNNSKTQASTWPDKDYKGTFQTPSLISNPPFLGSTGLMSSGALSEIDDLREYSRPHKRMALQEFRGIVVPSCVDNCAKDVEVGRGMQDVGGQATHMHKVPAAKKPSTPVLPSLRRDDVVSKEARPLSGWETSNWHAMRSSPSQSILHAQYNRMTGASVEDKTEARKNSDWKCLDLSKTPVLQQTQEDQSSPAKIEDRHVPSLCPRQLTPPINDSYLRLDQMRVPSTDHEYNRNNMFLGARTGLGSRNNISSPALPENSAETTKYLSRSITSRDPDEDPHPRMRSILDEQSEPPVRMSWSRRDHVRSTAAQRDDHNSTQQAAVPGHEDVRVACQSVVPSAKTSALHLDNVVPDVLPMRSDHTRLDRDSLYSATAPREDIAASRRVEDDAKVVQQQDRMQTQSLSPKNDAQLTFRSASQATRPRFDDAVSAENQGETQPQQQPQQQLQSQLQARIRPAQAQMTPVPVAVSQEPAEQQMITMISPKQQTALQAQPDVSGQQIMMRGQQMMLNGQTMFANGQQITMNGQTMMGPNTMMMPNQQFMMAPQPVQMPQQAMAMPQNVLMGQSAASGPGKQEYIFVPVAVPVRGSADMMQPLQTIHGQSFWPQMAQFMPMQAPMQMGAPMQPVPVSFMPQNPEAQRNAAESAEKKLARRIRSREAAVRQRQRQTDEYNTLINTGNELKRQCEELKRRNSILRRELA
mmetsp:Transcript_2262/g.6751  ORF Transcript_2262/g.6751 Transcript_2262/m.6751 type:complete len:770 (-) Transcript_2262:204-2513(-)